MLVLIDITERKLAEEQIEASLREKELLLKEIHHRVKNNMQIISSLISLQSSHVKNEEFVACMKDSQNRIKTMALIHEKLYNTSDLAHVDFRDYAESLMSSLSHSYITDQRVAVQIDIHNVSLDIDHAIPCGLIINELVSNCLKYAFPGGREWVIRIAMSQEDGLCTLIVGDNGIGLPLGVDYLNTTSLGLQLVATLTNQLNGKLECIREAGTTFRLEFPD